MVFYVRRNPVIHLLEMTLTFKTTELVVFEKQKHLQYVCTIQNTDKFKFLGNEIYNTSDLCVRTSQNFLDNEVRFNFSPRSTNTFNLNLWFSGNSTTYNGAVISVYLPLKVLE